MTTREPQKRKQLSDVPNDISSHTEPLPNLKMSKKMKLMMHSVDPKSNPLVELIPKESSHQQIKSNINTSANTPTMTKTTTSTTTPNNNNNKTNKMDQLNKLSTLTQQAIKPVKITMLPKRVVAPPSTKSLATNNITITPKTSSDPNSINKNDVHAKNNPPSTQHQKKKPVFDLSSQLMNNNKSNSAQPTLSPPKSHQQQHKKNDKTTQIKQQQSSLSTNSNTQDNHQFHKTTLQESLEKKLQGAQFRVLNQQLYTTTSDSAVELMKNEPELFEIYHQGFRTQVEKWPINPLDVIINKLKAQLTTLAKQSNNVDNGIKNSQQKKATHDDKSLLQTTTTYTIADFGCGDAQLALTLGHSAQIIPFNPKTHSFDCTDENVTNATAITTTTTTTNNKGDIKNQKNNNKQNSKGNNKNQDISTIDTVRVIGNGCHIYSFDLVAPTTPQMSLPIIKTKTTATTTAATTSVITACDSRNVPIPAGSVDVAVFCLSLMGTNFKDFLIEAHRVLITPSNKSRPSLIIAEVRSRFDEQQRDGNNNNNNNKNKKTSDPYQTFIKFVEQLGFSCLNMDKSNKMFVIFEFVKMKKNSKSHGDRYDEFTLKPCIYKRR